jgi:hypothetical protein
MTKARDTANLTGSGVTLPLLDIDAGTDIGAALVDADLMIVDDGAGGTNRKATMSRLATYMGGKITGGSMVYLASTGAISSGTASVSFTQFDASKYDHYQFHIQHVLPVTDGKYLWARVSTDGGSNYDATNGNYHRSETTDATAFWVARTALGNASGEFGASGIFYLFAPHNSSVGTYATSTGVMMGTSSIVYPFHGPHGEATGVHLTTADVDAIQFLISEGNIASGEIVMYGIANGT